MSDYIKREDAIKAFDPNQRQDWYTPWIVETLKDLPPADVEPVVRCKDCRWWAKQEKSIQGRCALNGTYPTGGWYCANGERKEDE